jgi:hypothetical protein
MLRSYAVVTCDCVQFCGVVEFEKPSLKTVFKTLRQSPEKELKKGKVWKRFPGFGPLIEKC